MSDIRLPTPFSRGSWIENLASIAKLRGLPTATRDMIAQNTRRRARRKSDLSEPIDPLTLDWHKNDAHLAREVKRTRERIRQIRRICCLWSQVDWNKKDEVVSIEIGREFTKTFGRKSYSGHSVNIVRRWRAAKDWLYQNRNSFRRSEDYRQTKRTVENWCQK